MKKINLILLTILFSLLSVHSKAVEKISLSGIYQKKNLFIQNQLGADGFGYAIHNIYINGDIYPGDFNARAIEVDFATVGLKMGQPVEILINYEGNKPRILNPYSIQPESTCKYENLSWKGNTLQFSTVNETGALTFSIQHYRWNKWIEVGQVKGVGTPNKNTYKFTVSPNTGENLYRVVQTKQSGNYNISTMTSLQGPSEKVTYQKKDKVVSFSRPTYFEVHDIYGNLLQKGYGNKIELKIKNNLAIYLSYNNETVLVKK